jgi:hypothetical protein
MPEKWAGFGQRTCRSVVRFEGSPRFYVAAFILIFGEAVLWIASPAVQRLAR